MITRDTLDNFIKETNLLVFSDNITIESVDDVLFELETREINKLIYENSLVTNFNKLMYDKESRVLYFDIDNELGIGLKNDEYLIIEEQNSMLRITKHSFTSEVINSDNVEYPIFESSIKQLYDGKCECKINIKFSLEQLVPVCIYNKIYDNINVINEFLYNKSVLEENKNNILLLQNIIENGIQCSILLEGVLYRFVNMSNGVVVLQELSDRYNSNTVYIELSNLFNRSFTMIHNNEYIVYDGIVYKNNEVVKDDSIPNTFKGSYYETMYNFYDTILRTEQNNDDENLKSIKEDIKENYNIISEKERNDEFYKIIDNGIVFIIKNSAILFDKENTEYIDSVMDEI